MSIEVQIETSLNESLEVKRKFWEENKALFFEVSEVLYKAIEANKKLLIFGNGGSACDALHFTGELVNRFMKERRPLPCIALNADTPLLTCIGNDFGFDQIFKKQIQALGQPGDVAIGISTSGNSPNIIEGLQAAKDQNLTTVALLGKNDGGKIKEANIADFNIIVSNSNSTPRIQECHEWILHSFCEYIDSKF